ncbi:hypothetical protein LSH36_109g01023 [Paralvinella palmiformis]|uniref:Uncharacterized protein n=1 Tax=Paralvinella palmiformis TaxID=53620 RepID=A0AAD9JYX9_9ANNE|nr:hypothetical protein LSH36_109g01023 [Paralvinella palmiformis]
MMKWVDCLCLALGLKENAEDIEPTQEPLNPQLGLPASPPQTTTLSPATIAVTDTSESAIPANNSQCPNGGYNNNLPHSNQKSPRQTEVDLSSYQKSEAYIPLVDCYTGDRDSTLLRHSVKNSEYLGSNDSIPSEPPPAPPIKSGRKLSEEVQQPGDPSLYDSPTKSYVNLGVDDNENVYKIPRSDGEGVYKIPCSASPDGRGLHRVVNIEFADEPDRAIRQSDWIAGHKMCDMSEDSDDGIYKIPRSDPVIEEDLYKVPPAIPCHDALHLSPPRTSLPSPGVEQTQHDVSVFSQVPLPHAANTLTESATPWRGSPDGEASPPDLQSGKTYRIPPPPVGDLYDVPKSTSPLAERRDNVESIIASSLYDTPKSCLKTASENSLLGSVVPAPDKSQASLRADDIPLPDGRYENLQQNAFQDNSLQRRSENLHTKMIPSHSRLSNANYYNQQPVLDAAPNIPPAKVYLKENEKMVYIPPPPRTCQAALAHSYINTPTSHYVNELHNNNTHGRSDSFYMPMSLKNPDAEDLPVDTIGDMYTDMGMPGNQLYSKPSSNRPVNPSVHDVVPPPSKTIQMWYCLHDGQECVMMCLAQMKKLVLLAASMINLQTVYHTRYLANWLIENYPPIVSTTFAAKMGALNCTPPAPKSHGEIQYLDLALDEQSEKGKNSLCLRTSTSGNVSPTDYKEIDFVKTKALNETQKDVESKRKSSERSADE